MYDNGFLLRHTFNHFDFGADADETFSFRGPTGHKGIIKKIGLMVDEAFLAGTTPAAVQLGTAADPDAFAKLNIPDGTADNDCFDETDDTDAIIDDTIPADQLVRVTLTQSTDPTADAGQGTAFCDIYWYE